jgi:ABC-type transport system involved in cytochrome c biogenesis permease component
MFIPFLAAAAVATTFTQLGAMSVQIAVLTLALKTMSVALLAATIAAVALFIRTRRQRLK